MKEPLEKSELNAAKLQNIYDFHRKEKKISNSFSCDDGFTNECGCSIVKKPFSFKKKFT